MPYNEINERIKEEMRTYGNRDLIVTSINISSTRKLLIRFWRLWMSIWNLIRIAANIRFIP